MALGPPVATKPSGFPVGFCGDRSPSCHVLHTSRQAMIKTYNADKCNIMTIARQTTPNVYLYQLNNQVLKHVNDCKYLGITISTNLSWETHVNTTAKKANSRIGFLKRNLKGRPKRLKQMAFITLTRSLLEYGMATWDPHLQKDIVTLERIQR